MMVLRLPACSLALVVPRCRVAKYSLLTFIMSTRLSPSAVIPA